MQYYYKLVLESVPRELEDQLTLICFEHGASGVSEDLQFKQSQHDYQPRTVITAQFTLFAYFENQIPEDLFELMQERFPQIAMQVLQGVKQWLFHRVTSHLGHPIVPRKQRREIHAADNEFTWNELH